MMWLFGRKILFIFGTNAAEEDITGCRSFQADLCIFAVSSVGKSNLSRKCLKQAAFSGGDFHFRREKGGTKHSIKFIRNFKKV